MLILLARRGSVLTLFFADPLKKYNSEDQKPKGVWLWYTP